MPYSNDYTQIKNGLVNYIGAAIQALPIPSAKEKSHYLVGELVTQVVTLAKMDNGFVDLYIYKPVIRSLVYVLELEIEKFKADLPYTKPAITSYQQIVDSLHQILQNIGDSNGQRKNDQISDR